MIFRLLIILLVALGVAQAQNVRVDPPGYFLPPVALISGLANAQRAPLGVTIATSGAAVTADRIYALPFVIAREASFTKLGANVTDATAAGNFKRGIYRDRGGAGGPGLLVADSGDIAVDGTGEKIGTIGSFTLSPGLYWQVFLASAAPSFSAATFAWFPLGNADIANGYRYAFRAFTYAALPANESAQTYANSSSGAPYIWIEP